MFKILTDFLVQKNHLDDWKYWKQWQDSMPPSHYESSDIFKYYLSQRPNFRPPDPSYTVMPGAEPYVYVFGDYASLLASWKESTNIIDYIKLLLDFYDVCKGYLRRVIGDPPCIDLLRQTVEKKSIIPLGQHNLLQYYYPYSELHAHTVAHFSLSTLIMRLIIHYIRTATRDLKFETIVPSTCYTVYKNRVYGRILEDGTVLSNQKTAPIPIPAKSEAESSSNPTTNHRSSWPKDHPRCFKCRRITEALYGDFNVCCDCYYKRICCICGDPAIIISDLPRCAKHQ